MALINSFIRIPSLVIRHSLVPLPRLGQLEPDVLEMRVWPNDIDFNLHLNNGRYLSMMDYGRVHLLARAQVLGLILKERWEPVVGAVWITYRRSLPLWASFRLTTRMVCWDERWFYMEQEFYRLSRGEAELAAVGWVKGAVRGREGTIAPQQVLERIEPGIVSPPMPEELQILNGLTRRKLDAATQGAGPNSVSMK